MDFSLADALAPEAGPRIAVLLNSPSPLEATLLAAVLRHSDWLLVADGALDSFERTAGAGVRVPDAVIGDMDSVRAETTARWTARGALALAIRDQDSNDLFKCLAVAELVGRHAGQAHNLRAWVEAVGLDALADRAAFRTDSLRGDFPKSPIASAAPTAHVEDGEKTREARADGGGGSGGGGGGEGGHGAATASILSPTLSLLTCSVIVMGALGGRLDQEMQNLNALFCWRRFRHLILLTEHCLVTLVPPGRSRLRLVPGEGPTCGILPIGAPARRVRSSGLRWNLAPGAPALAFGPLGCVSSSNHAEGEVVEIETDDPLVWTTVLELAEFLEVFAGSTASDAPKDRLE